MADNKPPSAPKPPNDRQAMVEALAALSVDASSPDGAVSVSVNTDGVMTRLRLSDAVSGMSPAEIADTVMRTYLEAQQGSAWRSAELMAPLGNAGYLTDRLRWRVAFEPTFQGTAEPLPRTDESPAPRRRQPAAGNAVLKDRSEEPAGPSPEEQSEPSESDDEYYEQGLRYKPAW